MDALRGYKYDSRRTDEIATLHMSVVAMAFACNYRRAASLQWGDPNDGTLYDVPSNDRGWKFNFISHRIQSDSPLNVPHVIWGSGGGFLQDAGDGRAHEDGLIE